MSDTHCVTLTLCNSKTRCFILDVNGCRDGVLSIAQWDLSAPTVCTWTSTTPCGSSSPSLMELHRVGGVLQQPPSYYHYLHWVWRTSESRAGLLDHPVQFLSVPSRPHHERWPMAPETHKRSLCTCRMFVP